MFSNGKIAGLVMIFVGVAACIVVAGFMAVGYTSGSTGIAGAALGLVALGILPMLLLGGIGVYLYFRGRKEEEAMADVRKKERLLGLIQAQGQASVGPIMMELEMTRDQVTNAIYELVALGLFSGYIDWDTITFFSEDASAVGSNACPNCGGVRELVGKGVIKCPYCGVSLFIPPDAVQNTADPRPPGSDPVEKK